ncbi:hypothetical protein NK553_26170 [Pseudomonas sp. ZM23]|uniref:Lipoprotein n=1 Tax=Pseudomonas triclosanedens TaxID=2961893 RepID=A0ABY6ZZ14_9PSED|nr:hypothetical protein [Pseudomonas triclosanedens]MCP8467443.1 hypothetical protein [Pseudomonas triclosanedens]MCP8469857.1 hypothetical protein [Pseudomonas triclosanedens]MCP8478832.1 hypothetical protein [Pseudomonas triclosanedens]WAI49188.1 hypothetical protein OU419_26150 [Pseudomonas triclosanedens]
MPHLRSGFAALLFVLLAGCSQQSPQQPPAPPPKPPVALAVDAQNCLTHVECTLKTSRTLLFVFDYADAGGALVESQGRLLSTPDKAPKNGWPALRIKLADPDGGRFEFHSECRQKRCRIKDSRLLNCYRKYLDGKTCRLR